MMRALMLMIFALISTSALAEGARCEANYKDGIAPVIQANVFKQMARPLCFNGFSVMHSGVTKTPLWSAQYLSREKLDQPKLKREDNFHEETLIPPNERATLADYKREAKMFNRGHLTPNGDLATRESKNDSFSLANIVPQDPYHNQVLWEGIETSVRGFVKNRSNAYVITGVLFLNGKQTINGRVAIPSHLFKLVWSQKDNVGGVYLAENKATDEYKLISVAELEKMAGIVFMPNQTMQEKEAILKLPAPQISQKNKARFSDGAVSQHHHHEKNSSSHWMKTQHLISKAAHLFSR